MRVVIWYESRDAASLVHDIAVRGYAAFVNTRIRQRELAAEVCWSLREAGRNVLEGEAVSPNFPSLIVDVDWHDYEAIKNAVAEEDRRWMGEHGFKVR